MLRYINQETVKSIQSHSSQATVFVNAIADSHSNVIFFFLHLLTPFIITQYEQVCEIRINGSL